jgi:GxxExxY protein
MSRPEAEDAKDARSAKNAKREGVAEPRTDVDALARAVIGAAIEVHSVLGPGFLESAYEAALCIELDLRGIPYERQVPIALPYKGSAIGLARMDLVVARQLVVELKAVETLTPLHVAQTLSYLAAAALRLGLIITFNVRLLRDGIKRVIRAP